LAAVREEVGKIAGDRAEKKAVEALVGRTEKGELGLMAVLGSLGPDLYANAMHAFNNPPAIGAQRTGAAGGFCGDCRLERSGDPELDARDRPARPGAGFEGGRRAGADPRAGVSTGRTRHDRTLAHTTVDCDRDRAKGGRAKRRSSRLRPQSTKSGAHGWPIRADARRSGWSSICRPGRRGADGLHSHRRRSQDFRSSVHHCRCHSPRVVAVTGAYDRLLAG